MKVFLAIETDIIDVGIKTELFKLSFSDTSPAPPHVRQLHRLHM